MPAPSSIYWNSEDSQRSEPTSSTSSASSRRRYIDPWDLENYAYLRRREIEIKVPRNDDGKIYVNNHQPNINNNNNNNNSSSNDSYYWYPMPVIRETNGGHDAAASSSVEDLYLGPSQRTTIETNQRNLYPVQQQASYEDEARYVTPNPVYVPLSDLEYPETSTEQVFPNILPRRRNRVIKKSLTHHHLEECPCPFHGPLPADIAMAKEMGTKPAKQLGLNTYGHLRIDYAKSWNSLNRKMKK